MASQKDAFSVRTGQSAFSPRMSSRHTRDLSISPLSTCSEKGRETRLCLSITQMESDDLPRQARAGQTGDNLQRKRSRFSHHLSDGARVDAEVSA
jgi:hypothetical protein